MRDPVLYRIKHAAHPHTGDDWCIYPMYDFAHCISDAIEDITHSICTLEFEDHRPFYDWLLDHISVACHPQQIEFARLNLTYTVMSKRKLLQLVKRRLVRGWDDPRMPTLSGLRRRGYTPEAIREFLRPHRRGQDQQHGGFRDAGVLRPRGPERRAPRVMGVLRPLKVVITNYPEGQSRGIRGREQPRGPRRPARAKCLFPGCFTSSRRISARCRPRAISGSRPGSEVRLKHAYYITCQQVVKDATGEHHRTALHL